MAEYPEVFRHVGLLFNAPPGHRAPSCSLFSHPMNSNPLLTGTTLLSGTSLDELIIAGPKGKASGSRNYHP